VSSAVRTATVHVDEGENRYFLVSGRGNNLEGTVGSGPSGEYAGFAVTDLCDTIGEYDPPSTANLFKCAPEVSLHDHHGNLRHLSEFRGSPVWVDLPAEWCGPCHTEANQMEETYQLYKDRGVKVISMLMDEEEPGPNWDGRPTQAECRAWGDRGGTTTTADHTFECWADSVQCPASVGKVCSSSDGPVTQEAWPVFNAFGLLPTNAIVDQGGRVVWTLAGWDGSVESLIRNRLNVLVGNPDSCLH
jgi:thiol-disulfide isomerase/thioredoxin